MKTTLLRLSRGAACLVLAGALLTGCALIPPASPRKEAAGSSALSYDPSRLEDGRLRLLYSYNGHGGGTVLHGGKVLYQGSSSDLLQLVRDNFTGEAVYYLVSHSTPGTEERVSTLYDANGTELLTLDRQANASVAGGLLVVNDYGGSWAFEGGAGPGSVQVFDLSTGKELPVPAEASGCIVSDTDGQVLVFNCYSLPEGIEHSYDDEEMPLHQYVLITDREGNVLLREDGCTANTLYADSNGAVMSDWLQLNWFNADWSVNHEELYNTATGQQLYGSNSSAISVVNDGIASIRAADGGHILYDLNGEQAVELGRFDYPLYYYTPGCVVLVGGENATDDVPYSLVDLASGETCGIRRVDYSGENHTLAVLTDDNVVRVYDSISGAVLTDVDAQLIENASYISVTALPDGYALLQYDDEGFNTFASQTYGTEGLLWDSSSSAKQYTYLSWLTRSDNSPLLAGRLDNSDNSDLYDVLDIKGNVLLSKLSGGYRTSDYPDDCFVARQGFDYGLMESTGQWLYRESIFSSPADESSGSYLY